MVDASKVNLYYSMGPRTFLYYCKQIIFILYPDVNYAEEILPQKE